MCLLKRLRNLADSTEPSPGVVGACMCEAADEIERLRGLLNKTSANNRTKARELRRVKHTDREPRNED